MRNSAVSMLIAFSLASAAFGQIVTASLEGTVLDPAGAVVPNAKVRIVNTATNLEMRGVSDSNGRFSFPSLPPGGPYSVTVEAAGFSTEERSGITLAVSGGSHRCVAAYRLLDRDYQSDCRRSVDRDGHGDYG